MGLFGGVGGFFPAKGAPGRQNPPLGVVNETTVSVPHVKEQRLAPPALSGPTPEPGTETPAVPEPVSPEVLWSGIINGYSGYAKANREIVRRIANSIKVSFAPDMPWNQAEDGSLALALMEKHRNIEVSVQAPRVTFYPPKTEGSAKFRVIYTMMETDPVHPGMIRVMNGNYDECWTPTYWNAGTFERSGLRIPVRVMPLGVDPTVYSPDVPALMPKAKLLTTRNAGKEEMPSGFLFVYVCQPTFRKGLDVVIDAFEEAFHSDKEAGLVLATTGYLCEGEDGRPYKSRIWLLSGKYSEPELASIYRACHVYVCTSRGEGWNLPMCEAAAVGLPVVVPRNTVHPELVPQDFGYFFDPDTSAGFYEARECSTWFEGIAFPDYSPAARSRLAKLLVDIKANYASAKETGDRYGRLIRANRTWDISARLIAERIGLLCRR